jgi:putative CocE/NonD family hydrolase
LRADVYRPKASGRYPVLIERAAYELAEQCQYAGEYYASRGYVVVGQNVRGRFASEGKFVLFFDEGCSDHRDGYDTILWAGKLSWSNGVVGMMDDSYKKTFSARRGTMFEGLRGGAHCHGSDVFDVWMPPQAIVDVFSMDKQTVGAWRDRTEKNYQKVRKDIIEHVRLETMRVQKMIFV